MQLQFDPEELRRLIQEVVGEVLSTIDWPAGRLALTEAEAAQACGVGRHVLRDLRLAGILRGRRLGKRVIYTRDDLLAALNVIDSSGQAINAAKTKRRA
jgi:hypothetical protein